MVEAPNAPAEKDVSDLIPRELVASAIEPMFQSAFHFMATRRGAHWELVEFEKTALIQGWTPIVQWLLARLGSQEQVMVTLAVGSTMAIVGGKVAQDIKRGSSKANIRTRESVASVASSVAGEAARPPAPSGSYEEQEE